MGNNKCYAYVMKKTRQANHQVVGIRLLFIVTLLVAFVTAVTYGFYNYMRTSTPVAEILKTVEAKARQQYQNLAVDANKVWPAQMGTQMALHDDNFSFGVSSQSMPTLYVWMKEDGDKATGASGPLAAHSIIADQLKRAGFERQSPWLSQLKHIYARADTTCLELFDDNQGVLTLSCYKPEIVTEVSQYAQDFVTAYNNANLNGTVGKSDTVGPIVIKSQHDEGVIGSSHEAGYDIAEVVVTQDGKKKLVLFYNKRGGPWQYIAQADDEYGFRCGDYTANEDVRKAMHNQVCLSETGHVRLDTTNPAL